MPDASAAHQPAHQPAQQATQQAAQDSDLRAELRLRLADEALSAAAGRLEALLREAARELRPFPPFPGAFFTIGIEVEPDGVLDRNIGCVVVTEQGDLRELQISFDDDGPAAQLGASDPVSMRDETLIELEHISPHDRLALAYNGLQAVTAILRDRATEE